MRPPYAAPLPRALLSTLAVLAALILLAQPAQPGLAVSEAPGASWDAAAHALPLATIVPINRVRLSPTAESCDHSSIQSAVDAAQPGDVIRLRADWDFSENITVTGKSVMIEGGYGPLCQDLVADARTQISGEGGRPLNIGGGSIVTLRNLTVTLGSAVSGGGVSVSGSSRATISNTLVLSNAAATGGGLYVGSGSEVTFTGKSQLANNTSTSSGAGAYVYGRLNLVGVTVRVVANYSDFDGGGLRVNGGVLTLVDADVVHNGAEGATGRGGGIYASAGAVITLTGAVSVGRVGEPNWAFDGAGIYADNAKIFAWTGGPVIGANAAVHNGGGVFLTGGSLFSGGPGAQIGLDTGAEGGNTAAHGGGVYAENSEVNFSGKIYNNAASESGGGMEVRSSGLHMYSAWVGGYLANQPNTTDGTGGGIILLEDSRAMISGTKIVSNTTLHDLGGNGAGIFASYSAITLTNSTLEGNVATGSLSVGGGLYCGEGSTFLDHSVIKKNKAGLGGGISIAAHCDTTITNGSEVSWNEAYQAAGGINVTLANLTVRDSVLKNNSTAGSGGAFRVHTNSSLTLEGAWTVEANSAGDDGGAFLVVDGSVVRLAPTAQGPSAGRLNGNTAGGQGGAAYVYSSTLEMHSATGGHLNINGNAAEEGGAVYAAGGTVVDVFGAVRFNNNQAASLGGAVSLAGGSRLWLDDFYELRPQLMSNQAQHGGAVSAREDSRVDCDGADLSYNTAGLQGGAAYLSGSTLDVENCDITYNTAGSWGGAIFSSDSTVILHTEPRLLEPAQAMAPEGIQMPTAHAPASCAYGNASDYCTLLGWNTAGSAVGTAGGGAIAADGTLLSIDQAFIVANSAPVGGAVYIYGNPGTTAITSTLVAGNIATTFGGAGIRAESGAITMTHLTSAHNLGGAGYEADGAVVDHIRNSIIWGNTDNWLGAVNTFACNIDQSDVVGPPSNPLFSNPLAVSSGFRPLTGSPAVNACANRGVTEDIVGTPRPVGTFWDMGAYEGPMYRRHLPLAGRQ